MSRARTADRRQSFLLPPSPEEWVAADDPVRFVADVVDSLDLAALGFVDPPASAPGRPPYSAAMLLGVWLYGYLRRVRSTRGLEMACRERMPLLWLTGMQYPDHNTLWRFYDQHRAPLRKLFKRVLQLAARAGLVGMVLHALDGTKLAAACSNESALHLESLLKEQARLLEQVVDDSMQQIDQRQSTEQGAVVLAPAQTERVARLAQIAEGLAALEQADLKHLHPQEPDARMQKVNGRFELGYNAQAVVDENHLLVAEQVVNDQNDLHQLEPMLRHRDETLGEKPEATAADSGYVTAASLEKVHAAGHTVVVAEQDVAAPRPDPSKPYDKSNFQFDRARNVMICPRGELLPLHGLTRKHRGGPLDAVYRCRNRQCPVRAECTRSPQGRTVARSVDDASLERQRKLQQTSLLQGAYARRKTLIEVVFAVLKQIDGFRRFTVRGLEKVRTQWSLLCTAYNLRKLYAHWCAGRFLRVAA